MDESAATEPSEPEADGSPFPQPSSKRAMIGGTCGNNRREIASFISANGLDDIVVRSDNSPVRTIIFPDTSAGRNRFPPKSVALRCLARQFADLGFIADKQRQLLMTGFEPFDRIGLLFFVGVDHRRTIDLERGSVARKAASDNAHPKFLDNGINRDTAEILLQTRYADPTDSFIRQQTRFGSRSRNQQYRRRDAAASEKLPNYHHKKRALLSCKNSRPPQPWLF